MATKKLIQGLSAQVPIVEDDGRPTAQFCDVLQRLAVTGALTKTSSGAIDVGSGSITLAQIQNIATQMIIARKTAGTGSLEVCTISDILDFLGTARGSIMYRGVSGWSLLAPGTSGNVLQTNGAGADPTWVTPSGGGGGGGYEAGPSGSVPLVSGMTWCNQGTATATNSSKTIFFKGGVNSVLQSLVVTAPGYPYDVYCRVDMLDVLAGTGQNPIGGIVLRNSATGNQLSIHTESNSSSYRVGSFRWTSAGAFSAGTGITTEWTYWPIRWVRANVTSTTVTLYVSTNGYDWALIPGSETLAGFLVNANQYGCFAYCSGGQNYNSYGYLSTTVPV